MNVTQRLRDIRGGYLALDSNQGFIDVGVESERWVSGTHHVGLTGFDLSILHDAVSSAVGSGWLSLCPVDGLPGRRFTVVLSCQRFPGDGGYCIPCSDGVRARIANALEGLVRASDGGEV